MSSQSNKNVTDDFVHDAAMRALHNWMDHFENLPKFGGADIFTDVYEWMKGQNPQYWSSREKRTPQIGDIFCAYLIVVGVCERHDISNALAILKDPEIKIRENGQTKDYWMQKLQKHLHIHSVEYCYEKGNPKPVGLKVDHHTDHVKKSWNGLSLDEKFQFLCDTTGLDISKIDLNDFEFTLLDNLGDYSVGEDFSPNDFGVVISPKKEKSTSENLQ